MLHFLVHRKSSIYDHKSNDNYKRHLMKNDNYNDILSALSSISSIRHTLNHQKVVHQNPKTNQEKNILSSKTNTIQHYLFNPNKFHLITIGVDQPWLMTSRKFSASTIRHTPMNFEGKKEKAEDQLECIVSKGIGKQQIEVAARTICQSICYQISVLHQKVLVNNIKVNQYRTPCSTCHILIFFNIIKKLFLFCQHFSINAVQAFFIIYELEDDGSLVRKPHCLSPMLQGT